MLPIREFETGFSMGGGMNDGAQDELLVSESLSLSRTGGGTIGGVGKRLDRRSSSVPLGSSAGLYAGEGEGEGA